MSPASHQTTRLSRGKHSNPEQGACVMELASILAGEPFTDQPRSVCPVVAGFLRSYNDGIDDAPRQDLYRFASLAVGTRSSDRVLEQRNRMCLDAVREWDVRLRRAPWRLLPPPIPDPLQGDGAAGTLAGAIAAKLVRRKRPGARKQALDFAERLIACAAAPSPRSHVGERGACEPVSP